MIYRRQEGTCITTMDVDWSEEQKYLFTISERKRERKRKTGRRSHPAQQLHKTSSVLKRTYVHLRISFLALSVCLYVSVYVMTLYASTSYRHRHRYRYRYRYRYSIYQVYNYLIYLPYPPNLSHLTSHLPA